MNPSIVRVLRALFCVYVAATFVHIAYVVHHEPFAFDAWNVAVDTDAKPATIGRFFEFWYQQYTSSNPRIGQPLAYLAYKLDGVAEVGTALAYLAIVLGAFVVGAGRWPQWKRNRDLAILAIGIGFLWFASPNLPAYMFCRAYATNYIWAIAIQLWFVAVLRLHARDLLTEPTIPKLAGYAVLGITAGMCNEHVGPTLILLTVAYVVWTRRRRIPALLPTVGAIALIVGYALVFFAPGQSQRYDGLGERYTLIQQILVRGFEKNLEIFLIFLGAAGPLLLVTLAMVVIGSQRDATDAERSEQKHAMRFLGLALLAATLITMTIFASPKLGPRFYMHGSVLLLAAALGALQAFIRTPRTIAPFVVLAVAASIFAGARTIPSYTRMAKASDERLAALAATPIGGVYTADAWTPIDETWWALGDDVRDQRKQEMVAKYFGLRRVLFRGGSQWRVLGVSDAKIAWDYEFDTPLSLDKVDELDLPPFIGRDIDGIHHAFLDDLAEIELVTKQRPRWVDLKVVLKGTHPPMPRKTLYIARWKAGVLEGYTAKLSRAGRTTERRIVPSEALKATGWDVYLLCVGDEPKKLGKVTDALTYVPWKSGEYWTLACNAEHCFVVMAVNHTI